MNRRWVNLGVLAAALSMAGCGGDGVTGVRGAPNDTTRQRIAQTHLWNGQSLGQSGVATPVMLRGLNGDAPGAAEGGFAGSPMPGGFFRHVLTTAAPGVVAVAGDGGEAPAVGGGGSGSPGEGWSNFYYDEWLALWVEVESSDNRWASLFFEDEAKTRPAGSAVTTWPADWGTFPKEFRSTYELTAGTMSGARGLHLVTLESESRGQASYEAVDGRGSTWQGQSAWNDQAASWSNSMTGPGGVWSRDFGDHRSTGVATIRSENSLGYRSVYNWSADGSGNARLEGPDPGLPATIVWDATGRGVMTYADGTTEEFQWWSWVSAGNGGEPEE
jgi:hypothetical protein